jgi:succinyl-diaminopimelate desuccinylase
VAIPSVSHDEAALANYVEASLRDVPWLTVDRVGDNVVARTTLGRPSRVVLGGHLDTVPGEQGARIEGDVLHGLGSADMKGGLAIYLDLARTVSEPACDVTFVFYAGEEVDARFNGLAHLFADRPELLEGNVAILGEPTDGWVEAGCQGTMRFELTLAGARAHTARPWMGVNAVHRLGKVLGVLDAYEARRPVIDGCEFREALQAVDPPAIPGLDRPLLKGMVERSGLPVRAKLGWTDVARFSEHGIPAVNLGPGDPVLAHTADERVERATLESVHAALLDLLTTPLPAS